MGRYDNKVKNNATITNMTNSKSFCGLTCKNYCTFACKGTSTKSTRPSAISTKKLIIVRMKTVCKTDSFH